VLAEERHYRCRRHRACKSVDVVALRARSGRALETRVYQSYDGSLGVDHGTAAVAVVDRSVDNDRVKGIVAVVRTRVHGEIGHYTRAYDYAEVCGIADDIYRVAHVEVFFASAAGKVEIIFTLSVCLEQGYVALGVGCDKRRLEGLTVAVSHGALAFVRYDVMVGYNVSVCRDEKAAACGIARVYLQRRAETVVGDDVAYGGVAHIVEILYLVVDLGISAEQRVEQRATAQRYGDADANNRYDDG